MTKHRVSESLCGACDTYSSHQPPQQVSPRERTDSELLYLSHIGKQTFTSEEEKRAAHPQWEALSSSASISIVTPLDCADALRNRYDSVRDALLALSARYIVLLWGFLMHRRSALPTSLYYAD